MKEPRDADGSRHPPENVVAGPVVLRRQSRDDAAAVADAVAASMEHLKPWMPWATQEAADPGNQRARIKGTEASWEAGSEFIYSLFLSRGGGAEAAGAATARGGGAGAAGAATARGGELLGMLGLHRRGGPGAIEMGYWVHAAHAGRGYATAAARALTSVALALPDVQRVEIHCDVANAASAAIPRKLGYRLDRIEEREPEAAGETGRMMIWVREHREI